MNHNYIFELIKKNKIGKLIKLMYDNVRVWSVKDYNDIWSETYDIHITKYLLSINNSNILNMDFLKFHDEFKYNYVYSLDGNGFCMYDDGVNPIYAIIDHNVVDYNIIIFIHYLHIAKYMFSYICMNKFDIIEDKIIRELKTCITFNFYNNDNISISDYAFLEFYYPGIIDKVMKK